VHKKGSLFRNGRGYAESVLPSASTREPLPAAHRKSHVGPTTSLSSSPRRLSSSRVVLLHDFTSRLSLPTTAAFNPARGRRRPCCRVVCPLPPRPPSPPFLTSPAACPRLLPISPSSGGASVAHDLPATDFAAYNPPTATPPPPTLPNRPPPPPRRVARPPPAIPPTPHHHCQ
jgi:hypothetical protein